MHWFNRAVNSCWVCCAAPSASFAARYSSRSGVPLVLPDPIRLKFFRMISNVSYPHNVKKASLIRALLPSSKKKSAIFSPSKKYRLNNSGGISVSKYFSKSATASSANTASFLATENLSESVSPKVHSLRSVSKSTSWPLLRPICIST